MWFSVIAGKIYEFQTPLFQPVGGMGMIGKAFGKQLTGAIKYNCKVTNIQQDGKGVTATYIDSKKGGAPQNGHCRLVRLHHSRHGAWPDSHECGRADEERDQLAVL